MGVNYKKYNYKRVAESILFAKMHLTHNKVCEMYTNNLKNKKLTLEMKEKTALSLQYNRKQCQIHLHFYLCEAKCKTHKYHFPTSRT